MMSDPPPEVREARRALNALRLEVPAEIGRSVSQHVELALEAAYQAGVRRSAGPLTMETVNRVLNVNLWTVRGFRAQVQVDFHEDGRILNVEVLNPDPANLPTLPPALGRAPQPWDSEPTPEAPR